MHGEDGPVHVHQQAGRQAEDQRAPRQPVGRVAHGAQPRRLITQKIERVRFCIGDVHEHHVERVRVRLQRDLGQVRELDLAGRAHDAQKLSRAGRSIWSALNSSEGRERGQHERLEPVAERRQRRRAGLAQRPADPQRAAAGAQVLQVRAQGQRLDLGGGRILRGSRARDCESKCQRQQRGEQARSQRKGQRRRPIRRPHRRVAPFRNLFRKRRGQTPPVYHVRAASGQRVLWR